MNRKGEAGVPAADSMDQITNFHVNSQYSSLITLDVMQGHFATSSSHINYYIDMTLLKTKRREAKACAKTLAQEYVVTTDIDTIICLDDTDIIGAYLADELANAGRLSTSSQNAIYIMTPEMTTSGQLFFRENYLPMIQGKNVLVLLATATTGKTISTALSCIEYYGGSIAGIAAIFSAAKEANGMKINAIFTTEDIPGYATFPAGKCPMCAAKQPLNAIVNSHGYSKL